MWDSNQVISVPVGNVAGRACQHLAAIILEHIFNALSHVVL